MSNTLEQERAKYALEAINKFEKGDKEKYRTLIKKLPAMILNNGLGQALAFLLADDEGKNKPSGRLYECLQEWINQQGIYTTGNFIDSLMNGDRTKYMHAQHESLKLLTWMTKFADAYLPKAEGG
jgi:CRISPR-associated protein Cmr5